MCRAQQAHGIAVQIASTDAEPGGHIRVELESSTTYKGVPAIFFRKQWSEAFKFSRSMASWLKRRVTDFDVLEIHGVFSHACISASRACRKKGVPYVIRPLGHLERWALDQKLARKKMFLKLGGMSMLRNAAAIHYTSASERHSSEQALALNHGAIIPFGINLDELTVPAGCEQDRNQRPYVLVLSRLLPTKGIDALLRAFLAVRKDSRLSDWQLVIAGVGPPKYEALLKDMIAQSDALRVGLTETRKRGRWPTHPCWRYLLTTSLSVYAWWRQWRMAYRFWLARKWPWRQRFRRPARAGLRRWR